MPKIYAKDLYKAFFQRGQQDLAIFVIKPFNILRQHIGKKHRIGCLLAHIDSWFWMRQTRQPLQFFGIIPDQTKPYTYLIDKHRRGFAPCAVFQCRNIGF